MHASNTATKLDASSLNPQDAGSSNTYEKRGLSLIKKTMQKTYSNAIMHWLEVILFERFGHRFKLSQTAAGQTHLSLEGSPLRIRIAADASTFTRASSDLPFTYWNGAAEGWRAPLGQPLPAPGAASLPVPLIEKDDAGFTIAYDILGLTYWMLSRHEEVGRSDLDVHSRFPARASHACKHGYLERPVVDEWLNVLGQAIFRLWPRASLVEHQFSVRVSHDVDGPSRYGFLNIRQLFRMMLGDMVKRRQFRSAMKAPLLWYQTGEKLHADDPANTFDWIMDVSERYGLTSAFYFICGRTDPRMDAQYEPEHPAIRDLMRRIHARGHEIGLHPSYNTYHSPAAIAREAARLRRICQQENIEQDTWGGRMHYLRWSTPTTFYGWELANMTYDSSLGYADLPGFRCGTSFEYPAFDPVRGKMLDLRIRPLIAMDCTVMVSDYVKPDQTEAVLQWFLRLKDACRAVNGSFTLLWHNSRFDCLTKRNLYTSILR